MTRWTIFPLLTISAFSLLTCSEPLSETKHQPEIRSMNFSRTLLYVEEFITVSADVRDEDEGDKLSYQWEATGGIFTNPNNNPTQWHAPKTADSYTITLKVSDGYFRIEKSTQIEVVAKP
jgi:hypothetical protein